MKFIRDSGTRTSPGIEELSNGQSRVFVDKPNRRDAVAAEFGLMRHNPALGLEAAPIVLLYH